jgi:hypothetical protein
MHSGTQVLDSGDPGRPVASDRLATAPRSAPATVEQILGARGPHPAHANALMTFGQFVGSWDVEATTHAPDGTTRTLLGEWHFFWVLEGRAIQDVILTPRRPERDARNWGEGDYQTAIRIYHPATDSWDVIAISPIYEQVHRLVARVEGDTIVLRGTRPDGRPQTWMFHDISPDRCRWQGKVSSDGGQTWFVDEEMILTRRR